MKYKMIVSDLDGTMFDWSLVAHENNLKSIKRVMNEGYIFVIATGRPCYSAIQIANSFGISSDEQYVICFNGGCVATANTGKLLFELQLEDEYAHYIIDHIKRFDCSIVAYINRKPYALRKDAQTEKYAETTAGNIIYDEGFDKKFKTGYNKILVRGEKSCLEQIQHSISGWAKGKVEHFFSCDSLLEFLNIRASKGRAMLELAHSLGIKKEEIIAIGDYFNDISMIKEAGLGVAVKDAPDGVKAHAAYITEKTAPEGAVSEVIEKFVLC